MAITDWLEVEYPIERQLVNDASVLPDSELQTKFLQIGIMGKNAVDLAQDL
jgi:DNA repair protein RadC